LHPHAAVVEGKQSRKGDEQVKVRTRLKVKIGIKRRRRGVEC
jgi:hypothetical protein